MARSPVCLALWILGMVVGTLAGGSCLQAGFVGAASFPVDVNPVAVAVGDFDGDGIPDLAVANARANSVSVLRGTGNGTFQTARSYAVGPQPQAVAVGDFNGDGSLDLAVTDEAGVTILLGRGDGTFQPPVTYPVVSQPVFVSVADINGDGMADLVVVNMASGTVAILLGKGDGTFRSPQSYRAGNFPHALAVGDLNGDGMLDLVVSCQDSLTVLLGNGDGTFQPFQRTPLSTGVQGLALGDFDGDGILDVVVTIAMTGHPYQGSVNVLHGNGDGSFAAPVSYVLGLNVRTVAVGDFNGDGILDLATADSDLSTVLVLRGQGDGTFQIVQSYVVGNYPLSLTVADLNGDGHPDLVMANTGITYPSNVVTVLLGKEDGSFQGAPHYSLSGGASRLAVADFNQDGVLDVVATSALSSTLSVLLGNGDGSFQAVQEFPVAPFVQDVAVGDVNGDGILDLLLVAPEPLTGAGQVFVALGRGDGSFQTPQLLARGLGFPRAVVVGDFNGDGPLDFAVTTVGASNSSALSVWLGRGDGTFQAGPTYALAGNAASLAVGDFNKDGIPDVAVALGPQEALGTVRVFLGHGDGTFQVSADEGAGLTPSSVATADFNGDSLLDLVVVNFDANSVNGTVTLLPGQGDGTFSISPGSVPAGAGAVALVVTDFNRDGVADLAVADANSGTVQLLLGRGDGTFQTGPSYAVGMLPQGLAVGDVNGDGFPDLVVAAGGGVTVLINAADW